MFTTANAESGKGIYRFLNLPYSARLASLGGENVSLQCEDVSMIYTNPALFTPQLSTKIAATYLNYLDNANGAAVSFAYTKDSLNYFGANMIFLGYGQFDGYDVYGNSTGAFSSGDFALNLVYARYLGSGIKLGLALKPIYSHIDTYSSMGMALDVGANYYNPDVDFSVGMAVRNFGIQFSGYYENESGSQHREEIPWNLQLGLTKGLLHAPFRFSVTFDNLNEWDLDYYREKKVTSSDIEGNESQTDDEINFADMLFRHIVFGVEMNFSKNFYLSAGYNHRRSREYTLSNARSINGFSFGAGLKIYKFNFDVAYAQYASAGNTFTLTMATSIDSFKK